jgi:hypothetical protein
MNQTYVLISRWLDDDDYGQPTMVEQRESFATLAEAEKAQRDTENSFWSLGTDIQLPIGG